MVHKYLIEDAKVEPAVTLIGNDNWLEFTVRYVVAYKFRRSRKNRLYSRILDDIDQTDGKVSIASATFHLSNPPFWMSASTSAKSPNLHPIPMKNRIDRPSWYRFPAIGRLLLALLLVWPHPGSTENASQPTVLACPSGEEIRLELTMRKDKLSKLKTSLDAFLAGQKVENTPLESLFKIDLNDAKAVSQRVGKLKQEAAASVPGKEQDLFIQCGLALASLNQNASELLALQKAVADLRLQFLTLPPEKMTAILHPQIEATAQADTVKALQEEHSSALEEQKQAAKTLAKIEQQELDAVAGTKGDLISARADLERIKADLTALQVKWVADLEKEANFYRETTEQLAEISRFLLQSQSKSEPSSLLNGEYLKATTIWRGLVDQTPQVVTGRRTLTLPELPVYPGQILEDSGDAPEAQQYIQAYNETKNFRQELLEKITARLQEGIDLHYRVLLQSGEIRSQLLNQMLDRDDYSALALSPNLLADVQREFSIVPYRWTATFYVRLLDVRKNLGQGWSGLAEAAGNLGLLLAFLAIPWLLWLITKSLSSRLNRFRISLIRQSRKHFWASYLAVIVQKIQPYAAWLVMLPAVFAAQKVLAMTVFSELALLLPYLRYYIYYRLFRQVMQCDFMWVNRQISNAKLGDLRHQVDVAARTMGLFALLILSFLTAIESLIRRGLIYHLASQTMFALSILIAMFFAYQWRRIIGGGLARLLPGKIGKPLGAVCTSYWGLLLAIPAFALLLLLLLLKQLGNWGYHFELTKRIAAELFRLRVETAINKTSSRHFTPPPEHYCRHFSLSGILAPEHLLKPAMTGFADIQTLLDRWQHDSNPIHSLAIIAHKGMGKTCLLDYLKKTANVNNVLQATATKKLTNKSQVDEFFSNLLKLPVEEISTALQNSDAAAADGKTLLLIDDAHNFFLSAQGGFAGYDALLELISQSSRDYFWCLAFNHHAWGYLNSVYARHHYFWAVVRLAPWPEQAIKQLILSSHSHTGFTLSYDDILQAVGSQGDFAEVTDIENRFFILLRQQSRGNPRLAVYLWLTSLRLVGDQALQVGLPDEMEISVLTSLPEDALFVFASIARHENLNLAQLLQTTQLPEAVVRQVLANGLRLKLLECGPDGVYRIANLLQYPLINFLEAKHCLYE